MFSSFSRLRKTDNNRLARACGATIVNRTEELKETDVGTTAGRFEIKKIGDEYFTFVTECKNPKVDLFLAHSYLHICNMSSMTAAGLAPFISVRGDTRGVHSRDEYLAALFNTESSFE